MFNAKTWRYRPISRATNRHRAEGDGAAPVPAPVPGVPSDLLHGQADRELIERIEGLFRVLVLVVPFEVAELSLELLENVLFTRGQPHAHRYSPQYSLDCPARRDNTAAY